jgi:hypothetical protein
MGSVQWRQLTKRNKIEAKKSQTKTKTTQKKKRTKAAKVVTQNLDEDLQEKRRTGPKADRSCTKSDPKEQNRCKRGGPGKNKSKPEEKLEGGGRWPELRH